MPGNISEAASALGKRGNAKRWANHVPDRPYIGDLPENQRRLILAAIRAEREKLEQGGAS